MKTPFFVERATVAKYLHSRLAQELCNYENYQRYNNDDDHTCWGDIFKCCFWSVTSSLLVGMVPLVLLSWPRYYAMLIITVQPVSLLFFLSHFEYIYLLCRYTRMCSYVYLYCKIYIFGPKVFPGVLHVPFLFII